VTSLEPIRGLQLGAKGSVTNLTILDCSNLRKVTSLAPLSGFTNLKTLNCGGMDGVTSLAPLSSLRRLTTLDCSWMSSITSLAPLSGLQCWPSANQLGAGGSVPCLTVLNCSNMSRETNVDLRGLQCQLAINSARLGAGGSVALHCTNWWDGPTAA